jgi:hypothetical protein
MDDCGGLIIILVYLKFLMSLRGKKANHSTLRNCIILRDKDVYCNKIFKDRTGLVWLGLNGMGVRKYSFESEKFNHFAYDQSLRKIIADPQNNMHANAWYGHFKIDTKGNLMSNIWEFK